MTATFIAFAAVHLAYLAWSFNIARPAIARLWILRCMLAGMVYDNLVLALGNIGVGHVWYASASTGRFVLHAAVLPLLMPYALSAMRATVMPLADRRDFAAFCWFLAVAAWGYGFWFDVGQLELAAAEVFGHHRLVSLSELPPFGTIAVNLVLIPLGLLVWRRSRWPLLFAGALFILLVNGATGARPWGYIVGNGAEVVFMLCLLLTERFLARP